MRIALLAAAALALTAVTAEAQHAPTRRKIVETITIDASADKVWAVVGNPADAGWIENVARAEQTGTPEKPGYRLTLKNGHAIVEEARKIDPERRSFAYYILQNEVSDLPAKAYSATISVQPEGDHAATVAWKAAFYRGHPNNDPPADQNDEAAVNAITGVYKSGLANVKKLAESR